MKEKRSRETKRRRDMLELELREESRRKTYWKRRGKNEEEGKRGRGVERQMLEEKNE